jgi:hypothetical protein
VMKVVVGVVMALFVLGLSGIAGATVNVDCGHGGNPACHEGDVQGAFNAQDVRDDSQDAAINGKASVTSVAASVGAEAAARAAADTTERNARVAGDALSMTGIAQEAAVRAGADANLQSQVNVNNARDNVQDWRLNANDRTDGSQWRAIGHLGSELTQGDQEVMDYIHANEDAYTFQPGTRGFGSMEVAKILTGNSGMYATFDMLHGGFVEYLLGIFATKTDANALDDAVNARVDELRARQVLLERDLHSVGWPGYNENEVKVLAAYEKAKRTGESQHVDGARIDPDGIGYKVPEVPKVVNETVPIVLPLPMPVVNVTIDDSTAGVYCEAHGGSFDAELGNCQFTNGRVCDAIAYLHGECTKA